MRNIPYLIFLVTTTFYFSFLGLTWANSGKICSDYFQKSKPLLAGECFLSLFAEKGLSREVKGSYLRNSAIAFANACPTKAQTVGRDKSLFFCHKALKLIKRYKQEKFCTTPALCNSSHMLARRLTKKIGFATLSVSFSKFKKIPFRLKGYRFFRSGTHSQKFEHLRPGRYEIRFVHPHTKSEETKVVILKPNETFKWKFQEQHTTKKKPATKLVQEKMHKKKVKISAMKPPKNPMVRNLFVSGVIASSLGVVATIVGGVTYTQVQAAMETPSRTKEDATNYLLATNSLFGLGGGLLIVGGGLLSSSFYVKNMRRLKAKKQRNTKMHPSNNTKTLLVQCGYSK